MGRKKEPEKKQFGRRLIQYRNGVKITQTVLDSLEEYEGNSEEIDEFGFTFLVSNPNYSEVYTVSKQDIEKYGDRLMDEFRVCPSVASVVARLRYGMTANEVNISQLPVIPIMEYKLVPTGNIYYFDPTIPIEEEKNLRRIWLKNKHRAEARWQKKRQKALEQQEQKEKKK